MNRSYYIIGMTLLYPRSLWIRITKPQKTMVYDYENNILRHTDEQCNVKLEYFDPMNRAVKQVIKHSKGDIVTEIHYDGLDDPAITVTYTRFDGHIKSGIIIPNGGVHQMRYNKNLRSKL